VHLPCYGHKMDFFFHLLVRTSLWVRRPPSKRWLIAAGSAIAIAAVIVTVERTVGWPDWATAERLPRHLGIRLH